MKTTIRRFTGLLMVIVLAMATFAGCGSSSGGSGSVNAKGKKILLALHDETDTFLPKITDAILAEAQAQGITADVVYAENNVDNQREQIKAAVGKYDAIICRLYDSSTALQMEIAAGDTPIVFINNQPDDSFLKADKYVYVASFEQDAGRYQAEYVWNGLGKPSSVNAIIFMGGKGHSAVEPRTNAIKYFFWDNNVDLNLVFLDYGDWSDTVVYDKMELFKNTHQQFDCIFANNDPMACGAIKWLKDNGYDTHKILVAGIDCTHDGCQAVMDGDMYMTVLQDTAGQGKAALHAAALLATGNSVMEMEETSADGKYIWVPFVAVDQSNAAQYFE